MAVVLNHNIKKIKACFSGLTTFADAFPMYMYTCRRNESLLS